MCHLKIFLRSLRRNVTYISINIGGLAIGITASVLIFLWVHHERSFDSFHPDAERIYRINNAVKVNDNFWLLDMSSIPFTLACRSEIPEIESIAVIEGPNFKSVTVNNKVFTKPNAVYVDRALLEMFHRQLLYGSFEAFGSHPFSVALTESEAKKFFGNEQATGQIIRINEADYTVQAVVKDHPSNSSLRYQMMVSIDALYSGRQLSGSWADVVRWITFVKLHPNADPAQVTQKMNDILEKNLKSLDLPFSLDITASLRLLTDMYFETDILEGGFFIRGNAKTVSIFALLGLLLLCTACINHINLTTARVTLRTKEVGVKKIVGANRWSLFLQFIAESLIFSLAATLVALLLIWLLSSPYQSLVNIPVLFSSPVIWAITGITLLFVTMLNGVYPALMLSSFQAVSILKGSSLPKMKNSSLRKVLTVFQFTLSTAMIICVITIYKQMMYIQNIDPGYRKDHIVRIKIPWSGEQSDVEKMKQIQPTIKGELQSLPDIVNASWCEEYIENVMLHQTGNVDWNGRAEDFSPLHFEMGADEDFMDVFELQMVEGRWFNATDMGNFILNETAIRQFNIPEPYIGERFKYGRTEGSIIGIVKDFHFKSLHEKIIPFFFYKSNEFNQILALKIQSGKSVEAIREVEAVWNKFFPNDPFEYTFVDDAFNNLYQSDIRTSRLMLIFSILAVVIAVLGLFGLSTFAIERRTKEIGIRKVLGASVLNIVHLLTREFLLLVAITFTIAAPLSWWAMNRWLQNFAYRIDITFWIFVAGAVITLAIALATIGIQSVKAATANPVKAIKSE